MDNIGLMSETINFIQGSKWVDSIGINADSGSWITIE